MEKYLLYYDLIFFLFYISKSTGYKRKNYWYLSKQIADIAIEVIII